MTNFPQNKSRSKVVSSTYRHSPSTTNAPTSSPGTIEHSTPTGFPEHQGPGAPQAELNVEGAQAVTASKNLLEEKDKEAAENFKECTVTAAQGGNLDVADAGLGRKARRKLPIPLLSHETSSLSSSRQGQRTARCQSRHSTRWLTRQNGKPQG
jgi:hypothetical protein